MSDDLFAYCILCDYRRRKQILTMLEKHCEAKVFSPKVMNHKKKQGVLQEVEEYFLPGYVFIFSDKEIVNIYQTYRIRGVYKVLGRVENRYCLEGNDRSFALELERFNGVVEKMKIWKTEDNMGIIDGSFSKVGDVSIIRLDIHKKRAKVRFCFDNTYFCVWVAVEVEER